MMTKYFTSAIVRFDPLSRRKTARIFLARIPPTTRNLIKIRTEFLGRSSTNKPLISVTFRDGKTIELDPCKESIDDVIEQLDRHSRTLHLQEQMNS
ncbi:hypothetical protein POJ06DRAFT_149568 [Lipomyces tetrasporus]|uniref:Large ribosomal subunit protein mL53 n=1 Tax=Lipomyces tetrasporus TaxID=54092 RepID=A0AAD7QP34_9ASCO|nr:uncharacterized protein POJ06DRAFT_149568 [Lipomyces tetrasporus]KAJ8098331.1 hypothetical protein POJ06DRAFT_149568 [Lipomyces tetrasporus]